MTKIKENKKNKIAVEIDQENQKRLDDQQPEGVANDGSENHKNLKVEADDYASKLEDKYAEIELRYKRVLADYDNAERRHEKELANIVVFANEVLLSKIIVILDDLEEAYKHNPDEGILKIIIKFKKILEDSGVSEIICEGLDFDSNMHEAIESSQGEKDKIVKVHRKGYRMNDKVIRPAMVAVGNGES